MALVQKFPFFQLFFLGYIDQENVFYDILERKNTFLGYKKRGSKRRKIDIFPKGLTHGFAKKNGHFSNIFFLGNISQENVFYDILQRKNTFLDYKKDVQKVEKLTFFQRGQPMLLVQKWPFLQFFFLGNIGQENVFYDILEQKNAFLGCKNKKFKKSKNWLFSMELVNGIAPKMAIFHTFV